MATRLQGLPSTCGSFGAGAAAPSAVSSPVRSDRNADSHSRSLICVPWSVAHVAAGLRHVPGSVISSSRSVSVRRLERVLHSPECRLALPGVRAAWSEVERRVRPNVNFTRANVNYTHLHVNYTRRYAHSRYPHSNRVTGVHESGQGRTWFPLPHTHFRTLNHVFCTPLNVNWTTPSPNWTQTHAKPHSGECGAQSSERKLDSGLRKLDSRGSNSVSGSGQRGLKSGRSRSRDANHVRSVQATPKVSQKVDGGAGLERLRSARRTRTPGKQTPVGTPRKGCQKWGTMVGS
jgi:hypothetical protein